MDDLFYIFEKLQGVHRTQCLEMFLNGLSVINNPYEKITKLHGFFNILNDKYVEYIHIIHNAYLLIYISYFHYLIQHNILFYNIFI